MHDNGEVEESMDCYFVDREGLDPMLSRIQTIDKEYSVEEEKLDLSFWVVLSELLSKGPRDSRFKIQGRILTLLVTAHFFSNIVSIV